MDALPGTLLLVALGSAVALAGCAEEADRSPDPFDSGQGDETPVGEPGRDDAAAGEEDTGTSGDGQTDPIPANELNDG